MITIGITFCDKDYQYYDRLVEQIKERVKLPYEIIVIDNTEGNKLEDKADFAFGYNAFQFAARYKIIKLAKGDYIWFIDGDDEILGLDYISDSDVIIFDYNEEDKEDPVEDKVYDCDFMSVEFLYSESKGALWNKLIKKSCFDNMDDYIDNPLLKVVSMEDTFYCCLAFKSAKTVESNHRVIYKHNPGLSGTRHITNDQMDTLLTGIEDVLKLFDKLGMDMRKPEVYYLAQYIPNAEDPAYVLSSLMRLVEDKDYWFDRYLNLYLVDERVKQAYMMKFNEVPKNKMIIGYPDGRKEVRYEDYKITRSVDNNLESCNLYSLLST